MTVLGGSILYQQSVQAVPNKPQLGDFPRTTTTKKQTVVTISTIWRQTRKLDLVAAIRVGDNGKLYTGMSALLLNRYRIRTVEASSFLCIWGMTTLY